MGSEVTQTNLHFLTLEEKLLMQVLVLEVEPIWYPLYLFGISQCICLIISIISSVIPNSIRIGKKRHLPIPIDRWLMDSNTSSWSSSQTKYHNKMVNDDWRRCSWFIELFLKFNNNFSMTKFENKARAISKMDRECYGCQ